jgi:hypothetical protein
MEIPINTFEHLGQIYANILVAKKGDTSVLEVEFKIDNGCNIVLLNKDTLRDLGFDVTKEALSKLPNESASLAVGTVSNFKCVGMIVMATETKKFICGVKVYCHANKTTRDLLGTSALHQFNEYNVKTGNTTTSMKGKLTLKKY